MSRLKLTALELGAKESLTREELKNIAGGTGPDGPWLCVCPDGKSWECIGNYNFCEGQSYSECGNGILATCSAYPG